MRPFRWRKKWSRYWPDFPEETAEIWAQALFALSLILFSFFKLRPVVDAPAE